MPDKKLYGSMMRLLKEVLFLDFGNVEDFRKRFKEFLTSNDVPDSIMLEIRKSMMGECFSKSFGVSITDFDSKIEKGE